MSQTTMESIRSAIDRIRKILREEESITDKASVHHVSLYMVSRMLTEDRCEMYNIPKTLSWESLYLMQNDISLENFGKKKDSLIARLDKLLNVEKFPFDIMNGSSHREIMECLNGISIRNAESSIDLLGYIYEMHLSTGSANSRDLGQFFTDRSICDFMVKLVKPMIKRGVPETVCDPTMGTAGFLSTVVKYLGSGVDWKKNQGRIHGCDHDERVSAFARVNLFLETGQVFENLKHRNSLKLELPRDDYDIILGNPPFGIDLIKYSQCNQKIRNLGIPATTSSEAIFLQLMMAYLAPQGRAAVVFPVSLLENKTQAPTRRYLLDKFELKRIVRMNGGNKKKSRFFLNTSVRCCIVMFENSGKSTSSIAYSEIERSDDGLLKETFVRDIPISEIDHDATLSVWKPRNSTEGTPLEDICVHQNGKPIAKKNLVEGEYPVMAGGTQYKGYHNEYNREPNTISISKSGTAGFVKFHTTRFWADDCFTITSKDPNVLDIRYLYYYLSANPDLIKSHVTGSSIPHSKWDDVKHVRVPLPSIEQQRTIVSQQDDIEMKVQDAMKFVNSAQELSHSSMKMALDTFGL